MAFKDNYYKLLCEREALKMQFLAQKSPIAKFIKNSLQLWYASQWDKDDPMHLFYGYGLPQFAIFRQIERKRALDGAREADSTGNLSAFTEPFESMVQNLIKVGENLQEYYECENIYEALREFHTAGFANPFSEKHIQGLAVEVRKRQKIDFVDSPLISEEVHNRVVGAMIRLAKLNLAERVDVLKTKAPACLGYPMGGVERGVKLGLTYDSKDPLKSLFNNWHEIGHACYRQFIPPGYMVGGRAMDESIAFMFEYHIGYSKEFIQFLLDNGLRNCGYDIASLEFEMRKINIDTKRINTNPLRHPIDIFIHSQFEQIIINEEKTGTPPEAIFAGVIEPYRDIFPEDYSFYQDAHTRGGVFGDREAYNAGYAGAFQLGQLLDVTMDNMVDIVRTIAKSKSKHFAPAIERITGAPLSVKYYMLWIEQVYNISKNNIAAQAYELETV